VRKKEEVFESWGFRLLEDQGDTSIEQLYNQICRIVITPACIASLQSFAELCVAKVQLTWWKPMPINSAVFFSVAATCPTPTAQ
jgi:hypothetical protein